MNDERTIKGFLRTGGALDDGFGSDTFGLTEGPPIEIGQVIGNVRITETIGSGGMGDVLLGIDERLDRKVAVKTLLTGTQPETFPVKR